MKLHHRLTVVLVLFLIIAAGTQGVFLLLAQNEFEQTIEQGATEIGQQTLHGILNALEREAVFHRAMAEEFDDSPVLAASNQEFATDTERLLAERDAAWRQGNETLHTAVQNNSLSDRLQERMTALETARDQRGIAEAFITNRYGGLVAAYGTPTDYDQSDDAWWEAARDGTYIDDVGYDRSANTMSITVAVPQREAGTLQGILKVVIDIRDPGRTLKHATQESAVIQRAYLVNGTDHVLWARDSALLGTRLQPSGDPLPARGLFAAPAPASTQQTDWLVVADQDRGYGLGQDFRLVLAFDPAVTAETEARMQQSAVATLLLFAVLAFILLGAARYYLHRPLLRLRETLDSVSRGDMDTEIGVDLLRRSDDIGKLARSFDRILASMRLAAKRSGIHTDTELREAEWRESRLESALDAAEAGIIVVDMDRNIVRYNKQFREMWNLDESVLKEGDDIAAVETVIDQLEDPDAFLEKVDYLYEHPREESRDTVRFKDGRVFERYSRPHILDGEVIGRVWSFHDVTEDHDETDNAADEDT